MADIEKLLEKQSQLMRSIERAVINFKKMGQDKMTAVATRNRLAFVKEAFTHCQDLDAEIAARSDNKTRALLPYFMEGKFDQCEDTFHESVDYFQGLLEQISPVQATTSLQQSSSSNPVVSPFSRAAWQLPAMKLPSFDGTLENWESFRDQFQSLVIQDKLLSETDKMHYLSSALTGEAKRAIAHLQITEANFKIAWDAVTSRYANPRRLISRHLQLLFAVSPATTESAKELRGLHDRLHGSIKALRILDCPVDHWDHVIVHFAVQGLDKASRKAWELKLGSTTQFPSFAQFSEFLLTRVSALESLVPIRIDAPQSAPSSSPRAKSINAHAATASQPICPVCNQEHLLYKCSSFLSKTVAERFNLIKRLRRCINCFSVKHSGNQCNSPHNCHECKQRHHTLLHFPARSSASESPSVAKLVKDGADHEVSSHLVDNRAHSILLSTARIQVRSSNTGCWEKARALIDPGSVATLVSEDLVHRLGLKRTRAPLCVSGIGGCTAYSQQTAVLQMSPASSREPVWSTAAVVFGSLTRYVPVTNIQRTNWNHVVGLELADDRPFSSDPIEVIIGADLYHEIILNGVRKGPRNEPIAQRTRLGWILSGPVSSSKSLSQVDVHHGMTEPLDEALRRFWELEEVPAAVMTDPKDDLCERHFISTHSRDHDGRYILRLPFNTDCVQLGDSRHTAVQCLFRLESRFLRDPTLADSYKSFMREYVALNHMEEVTPLPAGATTLSYFIPHHAVIKETSATSRLRVVFNASSKTTNGRSLNDCLLSGPKLQVDILGILLRWRQYRYVYSADIAKMYRQVLIQREDRDFQRIVWRESFSEPIREYQLKTVTYGMTSAPYMAIRVLHQLVADEGREFPNAVPVLLSQTYVDDCVFGSDNVDDLRQIREQLIELLARGRFRLRKWASNDASLLTDVDPDDHGLALGTTNPAEEMLSVLGLSWDPVRDHLRFRCAIPSPTVVNKRSILSVVAHLFDPLGWITPVVVTAKIFVQRLWIAKCDWDAEPPADIKARWLDYFHDLRHLNDLSIPRGVSVSITVTRELHGFADASTMAYAAVIYQRCTAEDGSVSVGLVVAKSKVAPVKTISVPRLELCAAVLLARLMKYVITAVDFREFTLHCWTDSTITLDWIRHHPNRWKVFVANRVSLIQTTLPDVPWRHIPTEQNPADCASRGVSSRQLHSHALWWQGPPWLREPRESWPTAIPTACDTSELEARKTIPSCVGITAEPWDLQFRYSSWPRLLRITAYLLRFITKLKQVHNTHITSASRPCQPLTANEVNQGKSFWLRVIQTESFPEDLVRLRCGKPVTASSSLASLSPFLDAEGLMRARGRLAHAELPESSKMPIILKSHPLVTLIIRDTHLRHLHAGPLLTLECLRQEYWLLRARATVRAVLFNCVTCTREKAITPHELMGDLPAARVTKVERPFVHTGVDYAGPLQAHVVLSRGRQARKVYIVVFICMATKAVHLEMATDATSAAFIAAYQRFTARRGLPLIMYSDNGTNFHGAHRELQEWYKAVVKDDKVATYFATENVQWHFLPPASPHFGGLWEAAVKSMKYHLKRCIGAHTLTHAELHTLLCRTEACLNSRPIASHSDCIEDYAALTPAHFLIGTALTMPPEPSVLHLPENRLSRWQLVQQITEGFWRSWQRDYLQILHQRPKWRTVQNLTREGQLVVLRDPQTPPCKWRLGRILTCHRGHDGLTRVVTLRTATNTLTRPIDKICFLPVAINEGTETRVNDGC